MPDAPGPSVADLHGRATRRLRSAFADDGRTDDAARDARLIVAHAAGFAPDRVLVAGAAPVSHEAACAAEEMLARRAAGTPVSRIVGHRAFYGRDFMVTEATLDPRPDSETIIDVTLRHVDAMAGRDAPLRLLDLGTGSGALLVTLLAELPLAVGIGVDLDADAVACARQNASLHGVGSRAGFLIGSWADAISAPFDLVVCNPPYVATGVIEGLSREVRDHDPRIALDGGADGLDAYRALLPTIPRLLADGGLAAVEIGFDQATVVTDMAGDSALSATMHRDLAGRPRVLELTNP